MVKKHIIMVILMMLCLSGCGDNNNDTTGNTAISSNTTPETTTEEKDTVAPKIALSEDVICCKVGENVKFDEFYEVSDDMDEESSIKVEIDDSKVDYNNPGKYIVSIKALDSSGNESTSSLDIYIYKDYTYDEMKDLLNNTLDEKYFDFKLYDSYADNPADENYLFEMDDGTGATNSPDGSTEIVGYIDWVMCSVGLNVSVTKNESHKNNNLSWNSDIMVSVVEYTNYGSLEDVSKVEFVSKNGKEVLSIPEDISGDWLYKTDEADYKLYNYGLCFPTEGNLEKFAKVIDGINPTIVLVSSSGNEIARIKMTETDVANFKSAISLYHDVNKYICNVPKENATLSSASDATELDAED